MTPGERLTPQPFTRKAHSEGECDGDATKCKWCAAEDARHADQLARGWKQVTCGNCRGYGVVSDYSGGDFNGAMDCPHCGGGMVWETPSGKHHALYPGGPFVD